MVVADAFVDGGDDAGGADGVDVAGLDDLEAAVAVVVVVREAGERGADAGVDVGVVAQQAFLVRVVEVGAVVDGGLLGGAAAEDLGPPGVEVRVEVDDRDGACVGGELAGCMGGVKGEVYRRLGSCCAAGAG